MGPEATIALMQKVLCAVSARDDADHVPLIVHQNPQVPSRIAALIDGQGVDPAPVLAGMARDLQAAGAQALAMPCNTAHHYSGAIADVTDLAFLNMLDLTATALAQKKAQRIGLLASPAVRLTGAFDASFAALGLQAVFPQDDAPILSVIRAVKMGKPADAALLVAEAQSLLDQGCDHILVACTELSLMTGALTHSIPWTDSLDCLTEAIVKFAKG
jgi:aspartate racemase